MSKKKLSKQIKEIADRLPPVKEEHASGFTIVDDQPQLNKYLVDVNHERRLRRAYESYGMEGIKKYLEYINNLQIKRSDELTKHSESL